MYPTISLTTTIRAPIEESLHFVRYHLSEGVDQIYLFFDDPNDPAIPFLENIEQVVCTKCDEKHWGDIDPRNLSIEERQHYNSRVGLEMARTNNQEWIIHIDSDELVYSKKGIKEYFRTIKPSVQVVNFPTLEAVQHGYEYDNVFTDISTFKIAPPQIYGNRKDRNVLRLKGAYQELAKKAVTYLGYEKTFSNGYIYGHVLGKSATRTSANITRLGNHYPTQEGGKPLNTIVAKKAWLLHFEVQGMASWHKKWERRYNGEATSTSMPPRTEKIGEKFISFYSSGDTEKLQGLYQDLYFLDEREKFVLKTFGLLKTIRIPRDKFDLQ
jgi:hypothetical protein